MRLLSRRTRRTLGYAAVVLGSTGGAVGLVEPLRPQAIDLARALLVLATHLVQGVPL